MQRTCYILLSPYQYISVMSQGKQGKHVKINPVVFWPQELKEHVGRAFSLLGGMALRNF